MSAKARPYGPLVSEIRLVRSSICPISPELLMSVADVAIASEKSIRVKVSYLGSIHVSA